jgi:selenocysteine lyase/cysteine desulfurase
MTLSTDRPLGLTIATTAEIRAAFPALERRHHVDRAAYFDGPGGTQVPRAVVEAMTDYLVHHNANTHWAFPTSEALVSTSIC